MSAQACEWFVGVNFGVPFAPYPYYYRPYYAPFYYEPYYYPPQYYPPVVVTLPAPPVYIEQGAQQQPAPVRQAAPQQEPASWWYYCVEAQGYYPYVKQCPGGWQQVSPQPPG